MALIFSVKSFFTGLAVNTSTELILSTVCAMAAHKDCTNWSPIPASHAGECQSMSVGWEHSWQFHLGYDKLAE